MIFLIALTGVKEICRNLLQTANVKESGVHLDPISGEVILMVFTLVRSTPSFLKIVTGNSSLGQMNFTVFVHVVHTNLNFMLNLFHVTVPLGNAHIQKSQTHMLSSITSINFHHRALVKWILTTSRGRLCGVGSTNVLMIFIYD